MNQYAMANSGFSLFIEHRSATALPLASVIEELYHNCGGNEILPRFEFCTQLKINVFLKPSKETLP